MAKKEENIEVVNNLTENYLGELKDPNQKDAERLVGSTVIATPPKFPPAFPCSIKIKDNKKRHLFRCLKSFIFYTYVSNSINEHRNNKVS